MTFPPGLERIVDALYPPARQALAEHLAVIGRTLYAVETALVLAALAIAARSGGVERAAAWLRRLLRFEPLVGAALGAGAVGGLALLTLPLSVYRFELLHDVGLSRQPAVDWLRDLAVATSIDAVVAALAAAALIGLVLWLPRAWPIAAATVMAPVLVAGNVLYPVAIAPMFNTFTPLPPTSMSQRILGIARANGIDASVVYQYDLSRQSTAANAYVAGLGGYERIALSDNLLRQLDPDEIVFVVTHEIGHYVLRHLWWGTFYAWLFALAAIGLAWWLDRRSRLRGEPGFASAGALPSAALALFVFSLVAQPLEVAISRGIEHQADVFAVGHAGVGSAGVTAFAKLGSTGLQVLHPPAWAVWYFYTHPPLDERIDFAAHAPPRR